MKKNTKQNRHRNSHQHIDALTGVHTALVTPFQKNGSIDWKAYEQHLIFQLKNGVKGLVPCGTTGETPCLSEEEKLRLIEVACRLGKPKGAVIIAGAGSNSTADTIENIKALKHLPIDYFLIVTPYYNKPSQQGLIEHFQAVADQAHRPILLYNVPGRTGVSLSAHSVGILSRHPNIIGIKEATGNLSLLCEMMSSVQENCTHEFVFLSGDDPTIIPFIALGGHGVISVVSNILPRNTVRIVAQYQEGKSLAATEHFKSLHRFFNHLFIEANPVPCKTVLSWQKRMTAHVRSPLTNLSKASTDTLKDTWQMIPKAILNYEL
jgi:4-hydroxy-tetrahydrodipicolinate synthase